MSAMFAQEVLKVVVGHCSNNIGWHGIQASSLDLLTEVLQKYMTEIGKSAHRYSEQFGRTEPNLDDIGLTFREMGIHIEDLANYIGNVEPSQLSSDLPKYPVPREHHLNFLKPGSHEVLSRPLHIYEYLPPMAVITEEEEQIAISNIPEANENSPSAQAPEAAETPSPRSNVFKRPEIGEKRNRLWFEEGGQPLRELTSVMMTTSGQLSYSRGGKLPEPRKISIEAEFEAEPSPPIDKKVTMKKIIEGMKRPEEPFKKSKETEEVVEKKPEKVKDKTTEKSKKKRKEKEMEEFAFFEKKEKPKVQSPKQKLSIFRKMNKVKEVEGITINENIDTGSLKEVPASPPATPSTPQTPVFNPVTVTPSPSSITASKKATKKEKKIKEKKANLSGTTIAAPPVVAPPVAAPPPPTKEDKTPLREEPKRSTKEEHLPMKDDSPTAGAAHPTPKKKRARKEPAVVAAEPNMERPQTPEIQTKAAPILASSKPFFPYPNHFPVPGLIPPPLFQNVPFNLLGMPMAAGLRPPLNVPPLNLSNQNNYMPTGAPSTPQPLQPPQPPAQHSAQQGTKEDSTPTGKSSSGGIIDSLRGGLTSASSAEDTAVTATAAPTAAALTAAAAAAEEALKKKERKEKKDKVKKKDKKEKEKKGDDKKGKKEKKKEKKEKERDKMKEKDPTASASSSTVPKITFKFGTAPSSPRPATPESTPKLIFKPMAEREHGLAASPLASSHPHHPHQEATPSPVAAATPPIEVAKFSALITRPPKPVKPAKKDLASAGAAAGEKNSKELLLATSPLPGVLAKSPLPPVAALGLSPAPGSSRPREKPQKPPKVTKEKDKEKEKEKKKSDKPGDVAVITETVGSYYDEFGNKIWICPACGRQDDGTPMIGCDECDDWYHWVCVGIRVPPSETESWFCQRCVAKKQGSFKDKKKGRKKKSL